MTRRILFIARKAWIVEYNPMLSWTRLGACSGLVAFLMRMLSRC